MKRIAIISKSGLLTLWVLCLLYQPAQAQSQDPFAGIWEGYFMKDFRTALLFDRGQDGAYVGKILMYSGENRIQDDELSDIRIEDRHLSFYIAAKETRYHGTFNEALTELSGSFIFPDQSEHPLVVRKADPGEAVGTTIAPPGTTPEPAGTVNAPDGTRTAPTEHTKFREKIPVDELKSDFLHLINQLRQYHPRLYSHTPEDTFNAEVSRVLNSLDEDMSLEEFYLKIAPVVASVKCSHTGIRLPAGYRDFIRENGAYLPLELHIQGNRAFVLSDYRPEGPGLAPGTELHSINGKPVSQIIDTLLALIPAEGNCMTTKYQELNRDFQSYFYLLDHSDRFDIGVTPPFNPPHILAEACPYSELQKEEVRAPSYPLSFELKADLDLGILEVPSFGIRDLEDYFAHLDTVFQRLRKEGISNLVLDLRDNSGGHPIFAAQLFSYLTDHEFTYFRRNPDVADFEPLYHPMQPNELHFTGNLYVLVNGACLSTTGHLISLLKYHTGAKFIGEEPGSTFQCNDFSMPLTLPHTGMEVNIPRTTFITAVTGFDAQVPFPVDYEVQLSVQDILHKKDPYLLYLQALLTRK